MFIDAMGKREALVGVASLFGLLSVITTVARFYTRIYLIKAFRKDDAVMGAATASETTSSLVTYANLFSQADSVFLIWWLCYMAYGLAVTVARLSIGLCWLRIAISKAQVYTVYLIQLVNSLAGIVFTFVVIFQCAPVSFYWMKALSGAEGSCVPINAFIGLGYCYGTVSALCDFGLCGVPAAIVLSTHLQKKTRVALTVLLGLGGLTGVCPLIRMAYLQNLGDPEFLFATVDIAIWSTVEVGLAITASNISTLRPLYRGLIRRGVLEDCGDIAPW
ncbi:hypothetical protein JX266_010714 [Neoarthrinium moseri]|nr:hypothetical protein JX266_010714 [Neoarthrinium moseri]